MASYSKKKKKLGAKEAKIPENDILAQAKIIYKYLGLK